MFSIMNRNGMEYVKQRRNIEIMMVLALLTVLNEAALCGCMTL